MCPCAFCNKRKCMTIECKWCSLEYCLKHLDINQHLCVNIEVYKQTKNNELREKLLSCKFENSGNLQERI